MKKGVSVPYARVPRAFVRQTIDLGGDAQKVDAAANEFSGSQTSNRLVITIGKFAVTDIFDTNKYAHDPHSALRVFRYRSHRRRRSFAFWQAMG